MKYKIFYKRNLPHYQPLEYPYFITFRLYNSLPQKVILNLQNKHESELKKVESINNLKERALKYRQYQEEYFYLFDNILAKTKYGPRWLSNSSIGNILKEALHYRDGKNYHLIAYTIMSNHVHLVIIPIVKRIADSLTSGTGIETGKSEAPVSKYPVSKIMQDFKKYTALKCNKVLNRSGEFWQHESYDHVIRDDEELTRIVKYVLNNPVKAGLIERYEDWEWSYFSPEFF